MGDGNFLTTPKPSLDIYLQETQTTFFHEQDLLVLIGGGGAFATSALGSFSVEPCYAHKRLDLSEANLQEDLLMDISVKFYLI